MRYDYKCSDCEMVFEVTHGIMDNSEVKCPDCGGVNTEKLITGVPAIVMNWWNAAASDDAGLTHKRFLGAVDKGEVDGCYA